MRLVASHTIEGLFILDFLKSFLFS